MILNGLILPKLEVKSLDGSIEVGRPLELIGSHAVGYNKYSIGICLIGDGSPSTDQLQALTNLCKEFQIKFNIPISNVRGHGELPGVKKACPGFPMQDFRRFWLGV